jgi:hypothetical protein
MRSIKLTSAMMALAALLALATAGAVSARTHRAGRHGAQSGVCQVSLNVAPRLITTGEAALAYGKGTCAAGTEAGQTATLYERAAGSPGYSVAGTTTTGPQGFFQLTTPTLTNTTVFYAAIGTGNSRLRTVKVAAQVTLVGPPETKQLFEGIHTGKRNAVTFTGAVSPDDAGAEVVLQRENAIHGNEWHRIAHPTLVNSTGGFAITHAFVVPGASDIRVLVRSNKRNVASPSNVLSYDISQSQNPSLTILSSADPIPFGGSVVISGTVASEPNTMVTLMGHGAGQHSTALATAMTNSEGKYSFAAQSPLVSTFYHVTGSGRSSSVLYEGVKYVLTATPSATSVPSGQALSFTGTVSPAIAGHTIYIERQNLTGTGFHVAAVGTVAANGSYSISHIFYAPGTMVLRVKIPGDPEHGGTAGEPVVVTVTPVANPEKLTPEPQGNSSLPPEGQV